MTLAAQTATKIPAQRQAELLALLRQRGAASIAELAAALDTSESTIRRDLEALAATGALRRTHGGAVAADRTALEPRFNDRRRHLPDEKIRIGQRAAALLEPGQSVIFDSSSTVLCAAEALAQRPIPLTAITNDVGTAATLAAIPGVNVIVPGGEIRAGSLTLLGATTHAFLQGLHVDVALIGIHAINGAHTLAEGGLAVAEAKRAIIAAAARSVLLADHSKFGAPALIDVAPLERIHDLVTDDAAPIDALEAIQAGGTRVHVV